MVRGENNYNKVISVILGEVWSIVEAHRKGPQPFSGWSGIRKFTVPCVEPKEMSRSTKGDVKITHSFHRYLWNLLCARC